MKLRISESKLRKAVIGTTVFNGLLLVTYIFHLITLMVNETYTLFILSLPSYLLSRSWLLLIGLFGLESLLLVYYWFKSKNAPSTRETQAEATLPETFDIDKLLEEDNEQLDLVENEALTSRETITDSNNPEPDYRPIEQEPLQDEPSQEPLEVYQSALDEMDTDDPTIELEFDKLWEEAIKHVRSAAIKKKAGLMQTSEKPKPIEAKPVRPLVARSMKEFTGKKTIAKDSSLENPLSRALIRKSKLKPKQLVFNPSLIRDEHREFYNEIALNNWIYRDSHDRKRVGIFKTALDETRFQEVDISYLFEAGVLHKLLIPFPSGAFMVYSINADEDKKIVRNILAKLCKQHNVILGRKNVAFVNYADLGVERKDWRFDFTIDQRFLSMIWISNFLVEDDFTATYSLSFQHKKELKALFAATQVLANSHQFQPMIITDYSCNKQIIQNHIEQQGFGQAIILPFGEKPFLKQFLGLLKGKRSVLSSEG